MNNNTQETQTIALVCEAGGPFKQLQLIEEGLTDFDRFYITYHTESTEGISGYLLPQRYQQVAGNIFERELNLEKVIIIFYAPIIAIYIMYILISESPNVVISTGDLTIAGPCFCIAKLLGMRTIFIESIGQFEGASTAGKILTPLTDRILVQNEEALDKHSDKAEYHGGIF